MRDFILTRYPNVTEVPLTPSMAQRHPGRICWPLRGELVPIERVRRCGRCIEITLEGGRQFLADMGSPAYVHPRRRRTPR